MSNCTSCLPYSSLDQRPGRPFGDMLCAFGRQAPDVLQHDQHLDAEDEGERLCEAFARFSGNGALERSRDALQEIDAVPALEKRLVAECAGLPLRCLLYTSPSPRD